MSFFVVVCCCTEEAHYIQFVITSWLDRVKTHSVVGFNQHRKTITDTLQYQKTGKIFRHLSRMIFVLIFRWRSMSSWPFLWQNYKQKKWKWYKWWVSWIIFLLARIIRTTEGLVKKWTKFSVVLNKIVHWIFFKCLVNFWKFMMI